MAALKIKQSDIHTIIFDFDGTLAKLNIDFQKMREAITALILSHGIASDQLLSHFVLEMIDDAYEILNQRSSLEAGAFLDTANAIIEKIETDAAGNGELFEYTKELLSTLHAAEISCGIITRNCAKAVKIVFPDILRWCPVVVCRDDVNKVKPHPEHISLALTRLGSSPHSTLMIGDHPIDITTGRNAGTFTCGVLTGRCQKSDFIEAGADIVLANASDILNITQ
jgi:phosphoglycolate phosphatase